MTPGMKRLFGVIVVCISVWAIINIFSLSEKPSNIHLSSEMSSALVEANQDFTYQGIPVHPFLVKEFETWMSDNCSPVTVSVDVIAASKARNEYSTSSVTVNGSQVKATDADDTGYYQYERLGILADGTQVLEVADSGGGSGVFKKLLFVRFSTDKAYDLNGKVYERLLMTVVREFPLGDRDDGNIEVGDDGVIVSSSKYREKPTVLTFE